LFRTLDEVVLPRLARGLNRVLRRGGTHRDPRGRVLGLVAVLGVGAVLASAAYVAGDSTPVDRSVGDVVRVGAVEGDRVAVYTDRARAELESLVAAGTAESYALVSLRGYATATGVLPMLADVATVRAFVRLPLPEVQTPIESFGVRTPAADLPAAMARIAARRDAGAREDETAAAGLTGSDPRERQLRAFYADSARLERTEAAAYRDGCACVYAVVVRATPVRLAELARRAGVRVVDAAPEVRRLDRTVFLPLLPEQTTVVAPPPDRTLPSAPLDAPAG
jgi:hypothetical protein